MCCLNTNKSKNIQVNYAFIDPDVHLVQAPVYVTVANIHYSDLCKRFIKEIRVGLRKIVYRSQMGYVEGDRTGFSADLNRLEQTVILDTKIFPNGLLLKTLYDDFITCTLKVKALVQTDNFSSRTEGHRPIFY